MTRRWTDHDLAGIEASLRNGTPLATIADLHGVSYRAMRGVVYRAGLSGIANEDGYVTFLDVVRMLTLNGEQSRKAQALHVCPLQFDIVDRLIERYSNPGELVYDPFGGLMTVPYRALDLGRRGRGVELNPSYFLDGVKYLRTMEEKVGMPSLFDLLDEEAA
jgi:hypothetical protein